MNTANSTEPSLRRRIDLRTAPGDSRRAVLKKQWLVTNGLGGYSSGTIAGAVTWRYHGLLISALPSPFGRTVMLNHLSEALRVVGGREIQFGGAEPKPGEPAQHPGALVEFRLENQLPFWRYEIEGAILEKRVLMPYLQNTVHVTYRLMSEHGEYELLLRPSVHFRPIEGSVATPLTEDYELRWQGRRLEIDSRENYPPLRLYVDSPDSFFTHDWGSRRDISYERDAERGYDSRGVLWSPGYYTLRLRPNTPVTLVASTEEWRTALALSSQEACATEMARRSRLIRIANPGAQQGPAAELVLAADAFIIRPAGRELDAARARAAGDELRSVIAGYHWFTDWGRDTMISLEGLAVVTGRHQEAAWILRTFARYVRDGLIPNLFPEGRNEGLYHTADASLWFFQAAHRYLEASGDRETLVSLLPVFQEIVSHHLRGTHFGIGVDPADGLLRQGREGYQLTWMDAKVEDWVVTPRRGKAVEINALWYNALRLLENWLRDGGRTAEAEEMKIHAERARDSFNRRFWNPETECLFDVIDGEAGADPAVRPNQVLAVSLTHPVLDRARWEAVMAAATNELLTPVGLRSLSPRHRDYKPKYSGDLRSRDAAYHQGTVWAWLIGPYVDAWLKLHPGDRAGVRRLLEGFVVQLNEGCVGSISEIFDAEPPFTERGCIAQAWSVAEVLRCFVQEAQG